jgi:hypothetical protein
MYGYALPEKCLNFPLLRLCGQLIRLYLAHRTCIDSLPSPLKLTEGNAVVFAPLDGHLPKFDLLKPIPSVPQVVFRK